MKKYFIVFLRICLNFELSAAFNAREADADHRHHRHHRSWSAATHNHHFGWVNSCIYEESNLHSINITPFFLQLKSIGWLMAVERTTATTNVDIVIPLVMRNTGGVGWRCVRGWPMERWPPDAALMRNRTAERHNKRQKPLKKSILFAQLRAALLQHRPPFSQPNQSTS